MHAQPLGHGIVVRPIDLDRITAAGIIIPDCHKERHIHGDVLAVGPGKRLKSGKVRPMDVQVGDRVYFRELSGTKHQIDGEDVIVITEDDVLGVMEAA